ncbi:unnamed protein product [Adineta steineri]|uniref:F-box domain-containing protein n=1 Tax=Adineta steineri TaxID=433720 RepID=A0A816E4K2_9BILA|nr:unnamed protein product [Adineta steineri]CAF1642827.1 unnamed protein product [Adineta steineri]
MSNRSSKRIFDEISLSANEIVENNLAVKIFKNMTDTTKSSFQDLCEDILLEIFQYLRSIDLLYSFNNLYSLLDTLLEPYTHTLDCRLMSKSYFQCLSQSLLPNLTNNLRVLRLSNTYTFSQISELIYKFDWSQINQIESLTFDSIKFDELSRYFLNIHPLLEHLWRLSLTFDEDDKFSKQLLINHIFISQSQSLINCFITGITFNLTEYILPEKINKNLRELTLTLSTTTDLIILFQILPHLEILTCTIINSTYTENIDQIQSLELLTILTLTINQPIEFKILQNILTPHIKLKRLSLRATLLDKNAKQEIGGLELEKLFRVFSQLNELHFYLRCSQSIGNHITTYQPVDLYLYSFTSHFWLDQSIKVFTHFIPETKQRYIYTLPFAYDTFYFDYDIQSSFLAPYPYCYKNVRHLILSSITHLNELTYSEIILKFFPNIKTITLVNIRLLCRTTNILHRYQWIRQRIQLNVPVNDRIYILNSQKSRQLYCQTLNTTNRDQGVNSKHIRQLTIYEITREQIINLSKFFPSIHVLTFYVNASVWFYSSTDWLDYLLTSMVSLFSLTIYYPKDMIIKNFYQLLVNSLITIKKHFYIKCCDGILNIWF